MKQGPDPRARPPGDAAQRPRTIGGIAYWVQRLAEDAMPPRTDARPPARRREATRIAVHADTEIAAAS